MVINRTLSPSHERLEDRIECLYLPALEIEDTDGVEGIDIFIQNGRNWLSYRADVKLLQILNDKEVEVDYERVKPTISDSNLGKSEFKGFPASDMTDYSVKRWRNDRVLTVVVNNYKGSHPKLAAYCVAVDLIEKYSDVMHDPPITFCDDQVQCGRAALDLHSYERILGVFSSLNIPSNLKIYLLYDNEVHHFFTENVHVRAAMPIGLLNRYKREELKTHLQRLSFAESQLKDGTVSLFVEMPECHQRLDPKSVAVATVQYYLSSFSWEPTGASTASFDVRSFPQ